MGHSQPMTVQQGFYANPFPRDTGLSEGPVYLKDSPIVFPNLLLI